MKKILLGTLMALSLSLSASASVTTATQDDGFNLHLSYPAIHTDKASTTVTINKFIRLYTDEAIKTYRSNRYDEVSMHYETTFENDHYVSVVLHVLYQGKYLAHPESYAYGLIFDKRTGDRADLSSEVIWPSPASILKGLVNREYVLLNEQDQSIVYDSSFKPLRMVNNFYLTKDGHLALLYQPGDVAPFSHGALHVLLPILLK